MRSFVRRALVLSGCVVAAIVASGCEGKKATEYVTGISTQVSVPRDLKGVRLQISVGGASVYCQGFQAYNGRVQLPRSLGNFAASATAADSALPVRIEIIGVASDDINSQFFSECGVAAVTMTAENKVRILRRSTQPYVPDSIRFIPMPLKYACYDKQCGEDQTCKGGTCVSDNVGDKISAAATFPIYDPSLLDGTGGDCFRVKSLKKNIEGHDVTLPGCMDTPLQAIEVDAAACKYVVPNTPSSTALAPPQLGLPNPFSPVPAGTPWDGVNVEVTYDGGLVKEILDKDKDEGFFIPDPANPQMFQLAPGLCSMVHGTDGAAHRITAIRTSGVCQAKTIQHPFCAEDQLTLMGLNPDGTAATQDATCSTVELTPPQSALVVIVDDSSGHAKFFDAVKKPFDINDEDTAVEPAIRQALSDPAFKRTSIGLDYSPGSTDNTVACGRDAALTIPPAATDTVRDQLLNSLKTHTTVTAPVSLEGALSRAYKELDDAKYASFYRRAVLVVGNRDFTDDAVCSGTPDPLPNAENERQGGVNTYVVQFTKDPPKSGAADALAAAGGTTGAAYKAQEATNKFTEIVNSLATCVYDIDPAAAPAQTDPVAFSSPLTAETVKAPFNAACSTENVAGEGWGQETVNGKTRIHLCQATCDKYRTFLHDTSQFAAIYQQEPLPVPVFAYKSCK